MQAWQIQSLMQGGLHLTTCVVAPLLLGSSLAYHDPLLGAGMAAVLAVIGVEICRSLHAHQGPRWHSYAVWVPVAMIGAYLVHAFLHSDLAPDWLLSPEQRLWRDIENAPRCGPN